MRSDRERVFNEKDKLENSLKNAGIEYDSYDLCMGKYVSQQAGRRLMKETIRLFQSYDCVITDRLHGMILSVISNVPCIAFDNHTHKISGVFAGIKDLQYVELITEEEIDGIARIIDTLYENKRKTGSYQPPVEAFENMANTIYGIIDGDR